MSSIRLFRQFCSKVSITTNLKSIQSLPSIPLHLFGIKTEENDFTVEERLNKDAIRYNENKLHESGMINGCPIGLNENWLLPTQSSTLKQLFKHDVNGKIHTKWYPHHVALTGTAMNTVNDKLHRRARNIFQPFFTDEALRDRYCIIKDFTMQFINNIQNETELINDYTNIFKHSQKWAFNVVLGFIFGDQVYKNQKADELIPLFKRYSLGFGDFDMDNVNKSDTILGDAMIARQQLLNEIQLLVDECYQLNNKSELNKKTIIYKMINSINIVDNDSNLNELKDNEMTLNEFMDNILLHVWAGHDTTASTTCNGIYYLHKYGKDLMEQITSDYTNNNDIINDYDYITSNVELDAFVKEIVRVLPTVPSVPKLFVDDVDINGYQIEKGNIMGIAPVLISKNDQIFDKYDPNEFIPERFIDNPPSKMVWLPFGFGSHMCIGWKLAYLELKTLVTLLSVYCNDNIKIDPNTASIAETWFLYYDIKAKW